MQHQLAVSPLPALSHRGPSLWNEAAPSDVLPLVISANAITDANRCALLMCPLLFNPIPTDRLNPHKRLDICDKRHNSHFSSFEFFGFFLLAFMRESCWVAQAGLRLTAFLLRSCKCQVYRHAPLCPATTSLTVLLCKTLWLFSINAEIQRKYSKNPKHPLLMYDKVSSHCTSQEQCTIE